MKIQILFLTLALGIFTSAVSQSLPYSRLFDDTHVSDIFIHIDPDSLSEMYANEESAYEYTALFIFDDGVAADTVQHIGFRLRGNTSLSSEKKSFKISFNTYERGRKYEGVEKLNLLGMHNDPTMVREKLYFDTYNAMGMPQRRSNFVKVYINGDYYGLYTNMEEVDEVFIQQRFGDNSGNLYKCTWPAPLDYRGENPSAYMNQGYELQTNEAQNDWSDLIELVKVIDNSSDEEFICNLEEIFNVQQYLWIYALDISAGHWDNYAGNINNYYLYHNRFTGKFEFLSFDCDNTFGVDWLGIDWAEQNIYDWPTGDYDVPLATRILEVPAYRNQFSTYLKIIRERYLHPDTVEQKILAWRDMIADAAAEDLYRTYDWGYTFDDFWNGFNTNAIDGHTPYGIINFIEKRITYTLDQLEDYTMPPAVWKMNQSPLVPGSGSAIALQAFVVDDGAIHSTSAYLYPDGNIATGFAVEMLDDGMHADEESGDGIYGCTLIAPTAMQYLDLLIVVSDAEGNTTLYPPCGYYHVNVAPPVPAVSINEILAINNAVIADEAGDYADYIELYNRGDTAVNLSGYFITDDPFNTDKWQLPFTVLNPDSYLIIWADEEEWQGQYHANFKLSGSGEFIGLFAPAATWFAPVDSFSYPAQQADIAYGRIPNGTGSPDLLPWPSPGKHNELSDTPPASDDAYPYLANNPGHLFSELFFISDGNTRYSVFLTDCTGRFIAELFDGIPAVGVVQLPIATSGFANGVYHVHLVGGADITTLALLKM